MNKMTETAIHAVLDGVKEGDVVRAVLESPATPSDKDASIWIDDWNFIRYYQRQLPDALISIENLGQPEKPELEIESFALLNDKLGVALKVDVDRWVIAGDETLYTDSEIKHSIKTLYNPDGTINEGWK